MPSYSLISTRSLPISPALRNDAAGAYGYVPGSAALNLGTSWRLQLKARHFGGTGYLLSINGDAPGGSFNRSNTGFIVGFAGAAVVEFWYFFSGGNAFRLAFPAGNRTRENTYEAIVSPGSVQLNLNGLPVASAAANFDMQFGSNGLYLGAFKPGEFPVRGRYDNLLVEKNGVPVLAANFNDGTGLDTSGNGRTVQLVNGAVIYPGAAPAPGQAGNTYSNTYDDTY